MPEELLPVVRRDLAAAPVELYRVTEKGTATPKTVAQLMEDYGTEASEIVVDLAAQRATFDGVRLTEAPCPLRPLEPEQSPDAQAWLEALGGPQAGPLLDWVASVTRLDEPCAALYLDGPGGTGKTLFADAMSRLWTMDGATPLDGVAGDFTDGSTRCPLIFGDEILPRVLRKEMGTGFLRELIQGRSRQLKRKFRPVATQKGAIRLVLAANNKHLLETEEGLSQNDISAIQERILYIETPLAAKAVLEAMGPARRKALYADGLAKHALWLAKNRTVCPTGRFLVSGQDSAMHRALSTGIGLGSSICHWCVSYLLAPAKMDVQRKLWVRIYKGKLLVNFRALTESWDTYITHTKAPVAGRMQRALSSLSQPRLRQLTAGNGKATAYREIRTEDLMAWNNEIGLATPEELAEALSKDTSLEGLPEAQETMT